MNKNIKENISELSAGDILRDARTNGRRKREIATIAKQLCIREEYLGALENGKYNEIPEIVYVLGFARNYAMELGLDPDSIVDKIKAELGLVADVSGDDEESDKEQPGVLNTDKPVKTNPVLISRLAQFVRRNWLWFVGGVVALGVVIVALVVFVPNRNQNSYDDSGAPSVTNVVEPEYKQDVRERFGVENKAGANVILQANQESWVKITDGHEKTVFSRVLVAGDVYYVPSGDTYLGTFGNAGGVDVWVNGVLQPKVGQNHTTKENVSLTFAK